ncbi:RC-LH1 core complex protein PufX [Tranquillimonas alkanivorans]|uniref:Intrinsic membrane protein PufX n=1 Tax=Tranquillimonas alkanivorans TaxID=441119 RepID=A0A1I5LEX3_9RHOB|nr:RC-LH1 core complex protein PufX [Tranquillimonas alkanivorans]SFO95396.1 Intrinsic membrane protein PufX [Tranquillimonas alkanivorans]
MPPSNDPADRGREMSGKYWYLEDQKPSLRMWAFTQMTIGAAYAAVVAFGVIAFILILVALSGLLPEDPYAVLDAGRAVLSA